MRRAEKKQAEEFAKMLDQAHDEIEKNIEKNKLDDARALLEQCQEGAIRLGELIEVREGAQFVTIPLLEAYCEVVYQIHEELGAAPSINGHNVYKKLKKSLIQVSNSIRNDIKVKLEVVFMPYKVSMWDSLESIWMAADADPECDAYVVPIPYYERNKNGSFGKFHYEGGSMPEYVPITHYDAYSIEDRHPDVVYIHNPYDEYNTVTSVDPRYYSYELKKHTEMLIYVPYYATSGGWGESKGFCSAYQHADYIIVQAEKYRNFFDAQVPKEKILPLGSPKFDKVIRLSNNPPEPPVEWQDKITSTDGSKKKVYFYNTSISRMLADTDKFLKKMEYVFETFRGREDSCLLWRPHPLLESTFDSMRQVYRAKYEKLKKQFLEEGFGIYDSTPDIEKTIALSDVYIGDAGSSVTSLFGLAGKPLIILNNSIHTLPEEDDWRGEIINSSCLYFFLYDTNEWKVMQGNKLFRSPKRDYHYSFVCDLSEYAYGDYYIRAFEIGGKVYVCPGSAQDIVVVDGGRIQRRITFKRCVERLHAFVDVMRIGTCLLLLPRNYPYAVKYDTATDKVEYLEGCREYFLAQVRGELRRGGYCVWKDYWLLASPTGDQVIAIDSKTNKREILKTGAKTAGGCIAMVPDETGIWLLPWEGRAITYWNPENGETREYTGLPKNFKCFYRGNGMECERFPFSRAAFYDKYVYLSPLWGNMFIRLDRETGEMEEWIPPFPVPLEEKNGHYATSLNSKGNFLEEMKENQEGLYKYFSLLDRKLYEISLKQNEYREIAITFDVGQLREQEPGFYKDSEQMMYCCRENAFNPLKNLLDGNIAGHAFDRDQQIAAYGSIAANHDGTSGEKIYSFVREKLLGR